LTFNTHWTSALLMKRNLYFWAPSLCALAVAALTFTGFVEAGDAALLLVALVGLAIAAEIFC
jgi:hypothetical protein